MRTLPHSQRPCLHHVQGRIPFKSCTNDYLCNRCEFDQYFYDEYSVHAVLRPVDVLDVEGVKVPHVLHLDGMVFPFAGQYASFLNVRPDDVFVGSPPSPDQVARQPPES